jgi:hypothetical protein
MPFIIFPLTFILITVIIELEAITIHFGGVMLSRILISINPGNDTNA